MKRALFFLLSFFFSAGLCPAQTQLRINNATGALTGPNAGQMPAFRTSIGLGTGNTPAFTGLSLGAATLIPSGSLADVLVIPGGFTLDNDFILGGFGDLFNTAEVGSAPGDRFGWWGGVGEDDRRYYMSTSHGEISNGWLFRGLDDEGSYFAMQSGGTPVKGRIGYEYASSVANPIMARWKGKIFTINLNPITGVRDDPLFPTIVKRWEWMWPVGDKTPLISGIEVGATTKVTWYATDAAEPDPTDAADWGTVANWDSSGLSVGRGIAIEGVAVVTPGDLEDDAFVTAINKRTLVVTTYAETGHNFVFIGTKADANPGTPIVPLDSTGVNLANINLTNARIYSPAMEEWSSFGDYRHWFTSASVAGVQNDLGAGVTGSHLSLLPINIELANGYIHGQGGGLPDFNVGSYRHGNGQTIVRIINRSTTGLGAGFQLANRNGTNHRYVVAGWSDPEDFAISDRTNNLDFYIQPDGDVGIGTGTPAAKLDVAGTVKATAFDGPITSHIEPVSIEVTASGNGDHPSSLLLSGAPYDIDNNLLNVPLLYIAEPSATGTINNFSLDGTLFGIRSHGLADFISCYSDASRVFHVDNDGDVFCRSFLTANGYGISAVGDLIGGAGRFIRWNGSTILYAPTDGRLQVYNNAEALQMDLNAGVLNAKGFESTDNATSLILKSPNGTRYRLQVANDGTLSTTAL